ncbi:MAG: hydrogenase formation protein HypD [Lachnospiraceae bacterium]|nr:hydrogenase formation protein HypD [Lachnospiraceae bacterium]
MTDKEIVEFLKNYTGPDVSLMEICGSHTAAIVKSGIRFFLSPHIRMVSGPGCPVCVTVTAYIDRLIALSEDPQNVICSFGDLLRVPGSRGTLEQAKAGGSNIRMLYSPLDMLELAEKDSLHNFIFAAVGFETTAPVYAALLENAIERGIRNIKILTSLKTMPEVVKCIGGRMDGYLLPGHVCTVTGYAVYEPLAAEMGIPMVAAGFDGRNIVQALYALLKLRGRGIVRNFYPSVVTREGNKKALMAMDNFFEAGDAAWRGLGIIENSGLFLRGEYERFDAGSRDLTEDRENTLCHCSKVITGEENSRDCPLFGKSCTPSDPKGACMVSREGACFNEYIK